MRKARNIHLVCPRQFELKFLELSFHECVLNVRMDFIILIGFYSTILFI